MSPSTELPDILTPEEVAAVLRVDRPRVFRMLRKGALPGVQIGNKWRISKAKLAAWLEGEA